jgi:hypothetical protein
MKTHWRNFCLPQRICRRRISSSLGKILRRQRAPYYGGNGCPKSLPLLPRTKRVPLIPRSFFTRPAAAVRPRPPCIYNGTCWSHPSVTLGECSAFARTIAPTPFQNHILLTGWATDCIFHFRWAPLRYLIQRSPSPSAPRRSWQSIGPRFSMPSQLFTPPY